MSDAGGPCRLLPHLGGAACAVVDWARSLAMRAPSPSSSLYFLSARRTGDFVQSANYDACPPYRESCSCIYEVGRVGSIVSWLLVISKGRSPGVNQSTTLMLPFGILLLRWSAPLLNTAQCSWLCNGDLQGLLKGITGQHPVCHRCCMILACVTLKTAGGILDWLCSARGWACGH